MRFSSRGGPRSALLAVAVVVGLQEATVPAAAQQDFLFRPPRLSVGLQAGYALPRAGGDLFDHTREHLTVTRDDFNALAFHGELGVRLTDRLDLAAGIGRAGSSTRSEFREWEGSDGLPIEQTTRFTRVPLTVSLKGYLVDRGRRVGRFAWVPARWAPYLGGGVGATWYSFEQEGEWVDFQDLAIFWDHFLSEGWAPAAHALAGLEVLLRPRWALTGETRYGWASKELSRDFVGFDDIDLAGFQAMVGISFRF